MSSTNFLSLRELRTSTSRINKMLSDDGKIIVTANGKPTALMIGLGESNLEETLALINQVKLARAIKNFRSNALQSGASELTLDDINAEIALSRQEKRQRLNQEDGNA